MFRKLDSMDSNKPRVEFLVSVDSYSTVLDFSETTLSFAIDISFSFTTTIVVKTLAPQEAVFIVERTFLHC